MKIHFLLHSIGDCRFGVIDDVSSAVVKSTMTKDVSELVVQTSFQQVWWTVILLLRFSLVVSRKYRIASLIHIGFDSKSRMCLANDFSFSLLLSFISPLLLHLAPARHHRMEKFQWRYGARHDFLVCLAVLRREARAGPNYLTPAKNHRSITRPTRILLRPASNMSIGSEVKCQGADFFGYMVPHPLLNVGEPDMLNQW